MALLPTNQRDQINLFVIVLAITAVVGFYMYPYDTRAQEIAKMDAHVAALDSVNKLAKADAAKGTAARLKKEVELYKGEVDLMRQLVPTGNEVPALLDQISTAARRAGLEVADIAPIAVTPGDHFDTYKYRLGVSGPYHAVAAFLTNVGSLPRIVAPMNLVLTPSARVSPTRKKTESQLDAKFDIQTYVVHATQPPAHTPVSAPGQP